jgi:hypothetical protein
MKRNNQALVPATSLTTKQHLLYQLGATMPQGLETDKKLIRNSMVTDMAVGFAGIVALRYCPPLAAATEALGMAAFSSVVITQAVRTLDHARIASKHFSGNFIGQIANLTARSDFFGNRMRSVAFSVAAATLLVNNAHLGQEQPRLDAQDSTQIMTKICAAPAGDMNMITLADGRTAQVRAQTSEAATTSIAITTKPVSAWTGIGAQDETFTIALPGNCRNSKPQQHARL